MLSSLTDLPTDLIARVAEFLPNQPKSKQGLDRPGKQISLDLLALRCASDECRKAVCVAVKSRKGGLFFWGRGDNNTSSPQSIEALGRVFGAGYRYLYMNGDGDSQAVLSAWSSLITSTQGRLSSLTIQKCSISPSQLISLCSTCPQLTSLEIRFHVPNIQSASLDELAAAVGRSCPLLTNVELPTALTPPECYARHFPRLESLDFAIAYTPDYNPDHQNSNYTPSRFDVISMAGEACVHVTSINFQCIVTGALVDCLLETPLRDRVTCLDFYGCANVSAETCLRAAAEFPNLNKFSAPEYYFDPLSAGGLEMSSAGFYTRLALVAPTIRKMDLPGNISDECMGVICHRFPLEEFQIAMYIGESEEELTSGAIPIIVSSPCATSLRKVSINTLASIRSGDLLQLVRGCPNVIELWFGDGTTPERDGANIALVRQILKSRGGALKGVTQC